MVGGKYKEKSKIDFFFDIIQLPFVWYVIHIDSI